jgi:hypothetical protein
MSSIMADQYSALVYEPKCRGRGGGGVAGSQPMSTAVHMSPNKLTPLTYAYAAAISSPVQGILCKKGGETSVAFCHLKFYMY